MNGDDGWNPFEDERRAELRAQDGTVGVMTMEDTYVYVSVKLYLKPGAAIQKVVQECDYSFKHEDIIETEIVDILDTQVPAPATLGGKRNEWKPPPPQRLQTKTVATYAIAGMFLYEAYIDVDLCWRGERPEDDQERYYDLYDKEGTWLSEAGPLHPLHGGVPTEAEVRLYLRQTRKDKE